MVRVANTASTHRRNVTVTFRFCVWDTRKVQRTADCAARWMESHLRRWSTFLASDRIKVEVEIGEGEEG